MHRVILNWPIYSLTLRLVEPVDKFQALARYDWSRSIATRQNGSPLSSASANHYGRGLDPLRAAPEDGGGAARAAAAPAILRSVEQAWLIKAPKGKPRGLFIFGFSSASCAPRRQFARVMRFLAASDRAPCSKNSWRSSNDYGNVGVNAPDGP